MYKPTVPKRMTYSVILILIIVLVLSAGPIFHEHDASSEPYALLVAFFVAYLHSWALRECRTYSGNLESELLELHQLAYNDSLTGLPNRRKFIEQLSNCIDGAENTPSEFTVLYIDLDRFKQVNDTCGHEAGDEVLVESAIRIAACLPQGTLLSRLGGDEFVVLLEKTLSQSNTKSLIDRIKAAVAQPYSLEHCQVRLGASVGVTNSKGGTRAVSEVLHAADLSMYEDKRRHRQKVVKNFNHGRICNLQIVA